jgi:acetyltransferase
MDALRELTPVMLSRFTQIDYDREMALVATTLVDGQEVMLGVARYMINPDASSCEFATAVADAWHGQGIGHRLMSSLIQVARDKGLAVMEGDVLAKNRSMIELSTSLGFEVLPHPDDPALKRMVKQL